MDKTWKYLIVVLFLATIAVWTNLAKTQNSLKIIACDVGQGDGILITKGKNQVLIDGGPPNGKAIDCLSRHMPPFDRDVEVVVVTHPQLDHFGGLIEVVQRYNVKLIIANSLDSSSSEYQALKNEVGGRGIRVLNPSDATDVRIGLMYLDILWPTQQFLAENTISAETLAGNSQVVAEKDVLGAMTSNRDPNDFSVVAVLSLGEFNALFTGDISPEISDIIADILYEKQMGSIEYIKVPHHGSKNGMSEKLLQSVEPDIAVISAGVNNRYGHPHKEILEMLKKYYVSTHGTYDEGDVVVDFRGTTK